MTCPSVGDNSGKPVLIPHTIFWLRPEEESRKTPREGPASHQVVGGVMAYQADDG